MKATKSGNSRIRIGVTFDFNEEYGFFLKPDLVSALLQNNIEIRPILYDAKVLQALLPTLSGILIPGGLSDVDPALYSQTANHERVKVLALRSQFEFLLLEKVLRAQMPLLAICWGMQIL